MHGWTSSPSGGSELFASLGAEALARVAAEGRSHVGWSATTPFSARAMRPGPVRRAKRAHSHRQRVDRTAGSHWWPSWNPVTSSARCPCSTTSRARLRLERWSVRSWSECRLKLCVRELEARPAVVVGRRGSVRRPAASCRRRHRGRHVAGRDRPHRQTIAGTVRPKRTSSPSRLPRRSWPAWSVRPGNG